MALTIFFCGGISLRACNTATRFKIAFLTLPNGNSNRRRRSEKRLSSEKGAKVWKSRRSPAFRSKCRAASSLDCSVRTAAGKTTTIGILTTRVIPTGGVGRIEGIDVARDPVAVKRSIGVVPQVNNLDRSLTAREILVFHAEYFGVPRQKREQNANELLKRFELAERADEKVTGFSGGMVQRLKSRAL